MSDNLIGATTAIFIVSLSIAVSDPVDVAWSTRDGTAKAGTDYQAANGVVSFLPGETQKQIEVIVYGQNVSPTGDKNFFINLMPPTNAVLGTTLIEAVIKVEDESGVPVTSVIVAQGKRGLKGDPGLSAYDQAVLMGYLGTLEDWMQEQADAAAAAQRASDYAANAAAAAAKAENAATAASFLGNIFPTPEAGVNPVTGVQNGAYYNVRSTEDDSYLVEYQNIGGVPTPTGKSFPSAAVVVEAAAAAAEVKEAIIDPVTGQASTLKVFTPSGENQEEINIETKTQLERSQKQLARTVWINDYGDVGSGQEASAAFQSAVNDAGVGGTVLFDGKGEYLLSVPTYILDKQEINGNGALLINNFDRTAYPRGTVQGLMQYGHNAAGGYTNLVSLGASTAITSFLSYTVNIASTANVNIGDMISVGQLSALVVAKTATTLTLDRFATYNIPSGTAVCKVNYLSNIYIHDFEIDFNGTVASPRWGYGVIGHAGLNCRTENIKSKYVGSKVVQYTRSISCSAKNIYNFVGTDNFGTGGHGYVVRFGGATDSCIAENVSGTDVRHTIDIAGGQRNKSYNCEAFLNTSSSFLTHGLESHYNELIDCNSYGAGDSAFHFPFEDKNNSIKGGYVNGRMFIGNTNFDDTTTFDGITIENSQAISPIGRTVFKNCKFLFKPSQTSSMFRYSGAENAEVVFNNCEFIFESGAIANALVSSDGTGKVKFVLNNPIIRVLGINSFSNFKAGDIIEFNGGSIDVVQTASTTPVFSSAGIIKAKDVRCSFETSGLYFFGKTQVSSVLSLEGCTFSNANGIWRRYAAGSKVNLGRNSLNNSSYLSLANTNLGTIGIANNIAYPPAGTWDIGSRIVNPAPESGGYAEYIMVAGGWKGASAIQA